MAVFIPQTVKILNISDTAYNTKTFVFDCAGFDSAPGQFVNLWLPDIDEKPFSVAADNGKELTLTICKVGPFTEKLFKCQVGDQLGMRGPYGKGFSILKNKKVILVGGGFGMAPLHFLGKKLQENSCEVISCIGARNRDCLVYVDQCQKSGFRSLLATDDGSVGHQGYVTDLLEETIKHEQVDIVQTCGPELMMKKVALICQQYSIPCELSMERYMKCGFGICGQCVCGGRRMCVDGPVVDGLWALEQDEFGGYHRGSEGQKLSTGHL